MCEAELENPLQNNLPNNFRFILFNETYKFSHANCFLTNLEKKDRRKYDVVQLQEPTFIRFSMRTGINVYVVQKDFPLRMGILITV